MSEKIIFHEWKNIFSWIKNMFSSDWILQSLLGDTSSHDWIYRAKNYALNAIFSRMPTTTILYQYIQCSWFEFHSRFEHFFWSWKSLFKIKTNVNHYNQIQPGLTTGDWHFDVFFKFNSLYFSGISDTSTDEATAKVWLTLLELYTGTEVV
jgi:hypothetical protein